MSDDSSSDPATLLRELAAILNETDMFEVEVRHGDLELRLSRGPAHGGGQPAYGYAAPAQPPAQPAPAQPAPAAEAPAESAGGEEDRNAVTSPMVGTVYLRPSPEEDVFAAPGGAVKEGDTVLLIEAMKTFNPIPAPKSGTLKKVLVTEGQPVEFGEPLFVIE